jgi:U6 snRNA-associated Sm-like protein LSm2
MLFFSFLKTLVDAEIIVELTTDVRIRGTLRAVDQFLNLKLTVRDHAPVSIPRFFSLH